MCTQHGAVELVGCQSDWQTTKPVLDLGIENMKVAIKMTSLFQTTNVLLLL